jgi:hypothetical protein
MWLLWEIVESSAKLCLEDHMNLWEDEKAISEWILVERVVKTWTVFNWLKLGSNIGILLRRHKYASLFCAKNDN